jgi:hypothetical protein
MHTFFYFVAVVPAGEETELLVGLQNEGNHNSPPISLSFISLSIANWHWFPFIYYTAFPFCWWPMLSPNSRLPQLN